MSLKKADLVEALIRERGLDLRESKAFIDLLFEEIRRRLAAGDNVKLSGFGNFELHDKRQRIGRNPKTGVQAAISARRVVRFRPGQKLLLRFVGSSAGDRSLARLVGMSREPLAGPSCVSGNRRDRWYVRGCCKGAKGTRRGPAVTEVLCRVRIGLI